MICPNCGKENYNWNDHCENCGAVLKPSQASQQENANQYNGQQPPQPNQQNPYQYNDGGQTPPYQQPSPPQNGYQQPGQPYYGQPYPPAYTQPISASQRWIALLLCCLGFVAVNGIHRFYVGKIGTGILYLLTGGLCGIGLIIDVIMIATGSFTDSAGLPLKR